MHFGAQSKNKRTQHPSRAQYLQETGVAPTDDGFTVIARGREHQDQDGPSLMSDSKWAFSELKTFGPALMNHFKLKVFCAGQSDGRGHRAHRMRGRDRR